MKSLEIIVCIKPIPEPKLWKDLKLDPQTKILRRDALPNIINPLDKHAIEEGLSLKERSGGHVKVITMAPPSGISCLREALAMGADQAYLLSDRAFAGADTLATANVLGAAIQKIGAFDLIICGQQTLDGGTAQVGPQLAHLLNIPSILSVSRLEPSPVGPWKIRSMVEHGYIELGVNLPFLISVTKELNSPRYTTFLGILEGEKKTTTTWSAKDLELREEEIGLSGSPTKMADFVMPELKRCGERFQGEPEDLADKVIESLYRAGVL